MDWKRGKWYPKNGGESSAKLMITGDWAPIRVFEPIIAETPEAIYGDLLPILRACDYRITNLECSLTKGENQISKSGSMFKGLPDHIRGLKEVPFEVVTTANNHVFDYGLEGFYETRQVLADNHIHSVGSGRDEEEASKPLIVDVKGVQLGIVNFSEGEDMTAAGDGPGVFGWEIEKASDIVRELKSRVDLVLVISHCGVEYIPFPPPYVEKAFHMMVDAGADLVIGHHPHVPQGIQVYKGVPICYSLGNYVFYQETELIHRKTGYMVQAGFSKSGLAEIEIVPYEIGANRLSLLHGEKREWFFGSLKQVSTPLEKPDGAQEAWNGFLCRYGKSGFKEEILTIMKRFEEDPEKGAAMFRNRITTIQHRQHWIDALSQVIEGTIDQAPDWSLSMLDTYLTQKR